MRRPSNTNYRLRVASVLGVAVLAVAVVATLAQAAKRTAPKCPRGGVHVLLADSSAEIYVRPESSTHGHFVPIGVYGCAYASGRPHELGFPPTGGPSGSSGVFLETLAGSVVGYSRFESHEFGAEGAVSADWIGVMDLAAGKLIHFVPTGSPPQKQGDVGNGRASSLVVKHDGSVAWINTAGPLGRQVHVLDKGGERVVASGGSIAADSLALAGSTLYWTEAGQARATILR